jgi:hypothetical protein
MSTVNYRLHVQQFNIPQSAPIMHVDLNGCNVHFAEFNRRGANSAVGPLYSQFRIYYISGLYLGLQAVYEENNVLS